MDEQIVWICWIWFFFSICMDRCILKLVDECICIDEQVFLCCICGYMEIWWMDVCVCMDIWIWYLCIICCELIHIGCNFFSMFPMYLGIYIYSIHMYEWCCQIWMLWNNSLYMSFVLGWVRLRTMIVRMFGLTLLSTKGIMGVLPRMDMKQALASSYSCYCIFF